MASPLLKLKSGGMRVRQVQKALHDAGFDPGKIDGDFGKHTDAAVRNFQASEGLLVDGIVGPRTMAKLGLTKEPKQPSLASLKRKYTTTRVAKLFPASSKSGIKKNLGNVLSAMHGEGLGDDLMILMALATIRAETTSFEPIPEGKSKYNTSPSGHPFNRYDSRKDLGNKGKPDGERYKGRGFVQLTGRANYKTIGKKVGCNLEKDPDLGCDSKIAGKILASFLATKERQIKEALLDDNLKAARKLVNGGSHGLTPFETTFKKGVKEFMA